MNYIEHLEKHCGEIKGSLELENMMEENIQFLKFENAPINATYTATSLGLRWKPDRHLNWVNFTVCLRRCSDNTALQGYT